MTAVSVFFARLQFLNFQVEFTHRHTWKLLHLKNRHRYNVAEHPFLDAPFLDGTLLAPAQFHNRSLADPHTWQAPAQNSALLEESTRIGLDPSEWRGECPENGALEALSHGTFLHVARQTRRRRSQIHYISRDHPNAHKLTNHIRHPSPEPCLMSPDAPGLWWRTWCGIVPVSPNGTTGSFPRILWIGIAYRFGFLWSS